MTVISRKGQGTLTLANPATQNLIKSTAMSLTLTPTGGALGCKYTISEYTTALPAGLTLVMAGDGLSAVVSGSPTTPDATHLVKFLVVASSGERQVTTGTNFNVADTLTIGNGLDSATAVGMTDGTPFSYQLYFEGGRTGGAGWIKASGTYPAGSVAFALSADGILTGTPNDDTDVEAITFTYTDANTSQVTTASVTFTVNSVVAITQAGVNFTNSVVTAHEIVVVGGTAPFGYAIDDDDLLPAGIVLVQDGSKTCVLCGTVPSGTSSATVNVTVTDLGAGNTGLAGATDDTSDFLITIL